MTHNLTVWVTSFVDGPIAWELHGVIFVFNPNIDTHGDDLNLYYEQFVKKAGIPDTNCIVFAHLKEGSGRRNVKLSKNFR